MPYLEAEKCRALNILPGTILSGNFSVPPEREGPHQEDYFHRDLKVEGACTSSEFKAALEFHLFDSVEEGFKIELGDRQKHIPAAHAVDRSIITISVLPKNVRIVENTFKPGKIRLHFTDRSGREFGFIGITDLGFHNYAVEHHGRTQMNQLNHWIHSQEEVLLRLGLSRRFQPQDGPDGYWLQANGVYTFPECHKGIRSYS
jgi:hypothetical protein